MQNLRHCAASVLLLGLALTLGGCTGNSGSPGTTQPSTSSPAASPSSPAASSPTATPPATPTAIPTTAPLTLYYIALGDNGASGPMIGCGDSAVAVMSAPLQFTDPVEAALSALLANHSAQIGASGLQNALSQSQLAVDDVERTGSGVVVHLSGTFSLAGECDDPRLEQQLQLTAEHAAGGPVTIMVNQKTLQEALSLK